MTDRDDVRTRVEDALRRAASSAYEAAHGFVEERDDADVAPRWRFRISGRAAVTAIVVVAVVGAMIVFVPPTVSRATAGGGVPPGLGSARGTPSPKLGSVPDTSSGGLEDLSARLPMSSVVVHVAGAVASPGLYTLDGGARVADAIEAAGGASEGADVDGINLARVLVDGEQVRVPLVGEAPGGEVPGAGGKVNINTSDAAALDSLPGVGPVLAARIVAYRQAHGPFASVDALDDVSGVGPAVIEKVRAAATV